MSFKNQGGSSSSDNNNNTERFGLWVGVGAAVVAAVGVLGLAFYTEYQATQPQDSASAVQATSAPQTQASQLPEIITPSSIPTSETQAASIAVATSDSQINGMTAPSDDDENEAQAASQAVQAKTASEAVAASSPAQTILAEERAIQAQSKVFAQVDSVSFVFAQNSSDLPNNSLDTLNSLLKNGKDDSKKIAIISYQQNADETKLSNERALAIRNVLLAMGIPDSHIEVKAPTQAPEQQNDGVQVKVVLQ